MIVKKIAITEHGQIRKRVMTREQINNKATKKKKREH